MTDDGDDVGQGVDRQVVRQLVALATDHDERLGEGADARLCLAVAPRSPAEAAQAPYEPGQGGRSGRPVHVI